MDTLSAVLFLILFIPTIVTLFKSASIMTYIVLLVILALAAFGTILFTPNGGFQAILWAAIVILLVSAGQMYYVKMNT